MLRFSIAVMLVLLTAGCAQLQPPPEVKTVYITVPGDLLAKGQDVKIPTQTDARTLFYWGADERAGRLACWGQLDAIKQLQIDDAKHRAQ